MDYDDIVSEIQQFSVDLLDAPDADARQRVADAIAESSALASMMLMLLAEKIRPLLSTDTIYQGGLIQ